MDSENSVNNETKPSIAHMISYRRAHNKCFLRPQGNVVVIKAFISGKEIYM